MSIYNVTPIELASYVAGEERKKREYMKNDRVKKPKKDPLFGGLVAYYSSSKSDDNPNKYTTYGKNRKFV